MILLIPDREAHNIIADNFKDKPSFLPKSNKKKNSNKQSCPQHH